MRYVLSFLLILTIVGCSQPNEENPDKQMESDTSTQEDAESNVKENNISASFNKLHFRLGIDDVKITGQAKSTNDEVFYRVEQGEELLVKETKMPLDDLDKDDWAEIDFTFELTDDMEESDEELFVVFYAKDEDDEEINPNYLAVNLNLQYNKESE